MRLFFIGWADQFEETADVVEDLKNRGHEITYWARDNVIFKVDAKKFPGTIFHDYYDATAARPAPGVDDANFPPPGEDFIRKMHRWETEIITMMNKKYEWMTVNERKHLYYRFLRYWDGVIKKYKPEMIVFPLAPHTLYDFVLYGLADLYRIPAVLFDLSTIGARVLVKNDYRLGSPALTEELKKIENTNIALSDLSPAMREYFLEETRPKTDAPPAYLERNIQEYEALPNWLRIKLNVIWVSLKDGSFFTKAFNYIIKKIKPNLKDEYERLQTAVDFNKKFIFVALHYQPECATSPLGGVFVDQILLIETLAAALPEGWIIYVKDHPLQWHPRGVNFTSYRYRGYYEQIAKIKNVFLAPIETNGYQLIKNSQAVATVTGSSAWEGILRGKPALVFGYPWYGECPGIFKVKDADTCREALKRIAAGGAVKNENIIKYLYAFDRVSFVGYLDSFRQAISKLSPKENRERFLKVFLAEIEKIEKV